MNTEKSLLSICIPTYNRGYLLKENLALLCPITEAYGINILISDNASPDDTEIIIKDLCSKYSNIYYVKQKENIGPDKNFEYVLKMSSSKYSWLLGDSCYITEKSLCLALSELKDSEWDLLITGDGERIRIRNIVSQIYSDPHILLEELGWYLTWMSCLIFNNKLIKKADFQHYHNSCFLQTGIIFEYLINNSCRVKINSKIQVFGFSLPKKNNWINIAFEIFCKDWYLFVMSLPVSYSFEEKIKCIKMHGCKSHLFTFKGLCSLRAKGVLNYSICQRYYFFIKQTISLNLYIVVLISLLPRSLITTIYNKIINLLVLWKK